MIKFAGERMEVHWVAGTIGTFLFLLNEMYSVLLSLIFLLAHLIFELSK